MAFQSLKDDFSSSQTLNQRTRWSCLRYRKKHSFHSNTFWYEHKNKCSIHRQVFGKRGAVSIKNHSDVISFLHLHWLKSNISCSTVNTHSVWSLFFMQSNGKVAHEWQCGVRRPILLLLWPQQRKNLIALTGSKLCGRFRSHNMKSCLAIFFHICSLREDISCDLLCKRDVGLRICWKFPQVFCQIQARRTSVLTYLSHQIVWWQAEFPFALFLLDWLGFTLDGLDNSTAVFTKVEKVRDILRVSELWPGCWVISL